MDEPLAGLEALLRRHPASALFRPGASRAAVEAAEAALGLSIPEPYRRFLLLFDGGFVSLCGATTDADWSHPQAEWNSNTLFGTERLVHEYKDQQLIWQADRGWQGPWPYLPFCQTDGQETLVFGPPDAAGRRPVLDAFHEVPPHEWGVLYSSFEAFLQAYVQGEGRLETISSHDRPDGLDLPPRPADS